MTELCDAQASYREAGAEAQLMHSRADGIASSRDSAIGFPQDSQVP